MDQESTSQSSASEVSPKPAPRKKAIRPAKRKAEAKGRKKTARKAPRAKAGRSKDPTYALIIRPGQKLYDAAWKKANRAGLSMADWLRGLLERATK